MERKLKMPKRICWSVGVTNLAKADEINRLNVTPPPEICSLAFQDCFAT